MPYLSPAQAIIDPSVLRAFAAQIQGRVIASGWPSDDRSRLVSNTSGGHEPALIVYCADAVDVSTAVTFARRHELETSVRSGGHHLPGQGVADGAVVIDLSRLKRIEVDPGQRLVRIEPGLTWGEIATTLQPYSLSLFSGDPTTTGIGGLTPGDGIGWMTGTHDPALDRLRSVDLIAADGRLAHASAEENTNLLREFRGGGDNFGIPVAFTFDLHPVGTVTHGDVFP